METYVSAYCYDCEITFTTGREGEALSESFIKKTSRDGGEWFSCPICKEGMEMATTRYDDQKRYFVIRYWQYRSLDGKVRPDVIWTDCGGSWDNAQEQQRMNMAMPDVSNSFIVRCFADESKEVADDAIKIITNL